MGYAFSDEDGSDAKHEFDVQQITELIPKKAKSRLSLFATSAGLMHRESQSK